MVSFIIFWLSGYIIIRQLVYRQMVLLDCGRDEEYDKGKKKKIRMKEEEMYAVPNPFQLFAPKKQQTDTKKKWTQRMNTAKTGFRI